jgi:5-(carboxyamino)imidazole ribonucleotide synthase
MQSKLKKVIQPPEFLGILGGGQLGRFFTIAAQKMGYSVVVFDPDEKSPAGRVADKHICKAYNDLKALDELKTCCRAVTTEFENIPAETLQYLEKNIIVRPGSKPVSIVQNRIKEKDFLRKCGIPVGQYIVIDNIDSIRKIDNGNNIFPAILKTAQFGYDGKGQVHVNNVVEVENAFISFKNAPCVLEEKLGLDGNFYELSVVLARSINGNCELFTYIENHHKIGILDVSVIPARTTSHHKEEAYELALKVASNLNYVGVMAVEFFISNDALYVNEVAPRPHNSGHFSIDACAYNQFDQQVLTLIGDEPRDTALHGPQLSLMLNLLGDLWFRTEEKKEPKFEMIKGPGIHLHLYGKAEPRIGRKMGHITILGSDNTEEGQVALIEKAEAVRKILWEN